MSIVGKASEICARVRHAWDTFTACAWCGEFERNCECGKWEDEPQQDTP